VYTHLCTQDKQKENSFNLWLQESFESLIFIPGIESRTLKVPPNVTHDELLDHIQFLNGDSHVDGILVQV
jgi:5,10-methylene-tetrahydrofolate dehydrogenase/methenyl tetrahydrofolate cyclohydrolase